ncbi:MAG: hypothetical protein GOMPHAMPRED_005495 [Gomphillus americanus]|uniref:very-long-chain enoyl-CoA reductase n=1 Tax=Gomphillus americanus TaxID=1940652 RepID=A0A8H3FVE0_9LECA|nr:MAG: hypothetical protein GOMPHAMPRED_005495 [Gomphillus americanus]
MSLTLQLLPKGKPIKNLPLDIAVPKEGVASEIYHQIATKSRYPVYQLRITKGSDGSVVPNDKNVSIAHTGLLEGSKVYVKDLGPQIGWRLCFVIEYLGPILIHPLFYFARPYIYSKPPQDPSWPISPADSEFPAPSTLQTLSCVMIVLHFLKREFETIFIHRFSNATMPLRNILKNWPHYWILSGVFMAYFTYSPYSPAAVERYPVLTTIGLGMFVVGELLNLYTHVVLMNLRAPGTTERRIPQGFSFNWVTCPNYMWETLAWIGIAMIQRNFATLVFVVVGVGQMWIWAKQKEGKYRRDFGDKYKKKRSVMLPGLL